MILGYRIPARYVILVMLILFVVGRWGFSQEGYRSWFSGLVPFQLILLALLTWSFQKNQTRKWAWVSLIWLLGGWAIEWVGVHTGYPFGPYHYGQTLGLSIDGIPLLIGLNWWLLLTQVNTFNGFKSFWMRTIFSATVLTFTDWCLEPMATAMDYWTWETTGGEIPWMNYGGWFVVSFFFSGLYSIFKIHQDNVISFPLWILQILFFLSFRLF